MIPRSTVIRLTCAALATTAVGSTLATVVAGTAPRAPDAREQAAPATTAAVPPARRAPAEEPPARVGHDQAADEAADRAIELFMIALTRDPDRRDESLEALNRAHAASPQHPRVPLHLGLAHLRQASEAPEGHPDTIGHLIQAQHHLRLAAERLPADTRIPGWLHSAGYFLATTEQRPRDASIHLDALRRAFDDDPCFHAIPLGLALYDAPRDGPRFREGLDAMRAPMTCADGDPSGRNGPRWPHNVEGYLLTLAEFEIKAGERVRAETALMALEASPDVASWPYRERARARFASLDEDIAAHARGAEDTPSLSIGAGTRASCTICHLGAP